MATQSDVDPSGILMDAKELSKMSSDQPRSHHKRPIAENEAPPKEVEQAPEPNVSLTKEMFAEQLHLLAERARAAGLHPIQTMARTYIKHGFAIIEGFLDSLEKADRPKKRKK